MATPATELPTESKPTAPPLQSSRMSEAIQKRTVWIVFVPNETSMADMMVETFWANLAMRLRAGDRIEVEPDNRSYFMELRVHSCGRLYANVSLMRMVEFGTVETRASEQSEYITKWGGGHAMYQVLSKDNVVLMDGLQTEDAARRWIKSHIEALRN